MKSIIVILVLTISVASASENNSNSSFNCEADRQCLIAAKVCGYLAGVDTGRKICVSKGEAPDVRHVWKNEVKTNHCMGFLPIITVLNNESLSEKFISSYLQGYQDSYIASGCELPRFGK